MITLYHCSDARSFRPLWTLEELGLGYELKMLPFPPRVLSRDYLKVNPLGTIPAFFDGETRMTESAAIVEYLIARHGEARLGVGKEDPAFGAYLNWLHFGEATLTFPQTLVLRYTRLEPAERRQPQVAEDYAKWFLSRLRAVDAVVGEAPFLLGERFTGADISVGYALLLAQTLGLADRFAEPTAAYWARLQAREGFQRAKAVQAREAASQGVAAAQVSAMIGQG
ncbi:MAG: glutathione S-transferase family protein [Caulobacteraceae bacterium]|nr:glutathione S-transferase family protein [Caulobacteraceae bacterium]